MSLRIGRFLPGGKSPWHEDFSPVYDRAAAARGIAAPMLTKSRLTVPKRNTSGVREAFTSRPANADFGPCGTRSLSRCLTSKQGCHGIDLTAGQGREARSGSSTATGAGYEELDRDAIIRDGCGQRAQAAGREMISP
jgi:hypothetical protein